MGTQFKKEKKTENNKVGTNDIKSKKSKDPYLIKKEKKLDD